MQDIATRTLTKPDVGSNHVHHRAGSARERLRVLVLGMQVWVIGVAWPMLDGMRSVGGVELGLGAACLMALIAGTLLPARASSGAVRDRVQPGLWLVVFPALLAACCGARPERWNQHLYGSFGLVLLWLALCAFGAKAALVSAGEPPRMPSTSVPLDEAAQPTGASHALLRQRGLALLCVIGGAAIALIAPTWGGLPALERAWGDAALTGGVLTAVIGGALGVTTVAVFLGQGLREPTPAPAPTRRELVLRTLGYLWLAVLGAVTYFVVIPR
jgi:hypothetical protein